MDIKKAAAEYEVQMQNAIRAHRKCQEMARKEEAIERQIKDCTREVEEKMAWIRDAQARLAASKERHRIALEELQKTVPLASQSPSRVKQEQQVAAAPSPVAAGASSSVRTRSRKRNIGAVAPDSPTAESRRHGGTF